MPCPVPQLHGMYRMLQRTAVTPPDTLAVWHVSDEARCLVADAAGGGGRSRWRGVGPECTVPVLSPFKRWDWKANRSLEYDIAVPTVQQHGSHDDALYFYPEVRSYVQGKGSQSLDIVIALASKEHHSFGPRLCVHACADAHAPPGRGWRAPTALHCPCMRCVTTKQPRCMRC